MLNYKRSMSNGLNNNLIKMNFYKKNEAHPSREHLLNWINTWEKNIAFIKLRIKQQEATEVRGRKYFHSDIEEQQAKIDIVKNKYKDILN